VKLLRFDAGVGKAIDVFGSRGLVQSRMAMSSEPVQAGCFYLTVGGMVGYHQTVKNQLFAVVQGTGWVRGQDKERVPITAGQAAFWEAGEWHESGTDEGMTVIVMEGDGLDSAQYMPSA
jgi:gentisate 1,2-dioxygenase